MEDQRITLLYGRYAGESKLWSMMPEVQEVYWKARVAVSTSQPLTRLSDRVNDRVLSILPLIRKQRLDVTCTSTWIVFVY